jgi:hypothetical protein
MFKNVPLNELIKNLDTILESNIFQILTDNKDKCKDYEPSNYIFVIFKSIISLYILIIGRLLKSNEASIGTNNKFISFEELVDIMIKYSVFLKDDLFSNTFSNLDKTFKKKLIQFSSVDGAIAGWLTFSVLNPEMTNEDCYLYLNIDADTYKFNNMERILEKSNIKYSYDKYQTYLDVSMHSKEYIIFENEYKYE